MNQAAIKAKFAPFVTLSTMDTIAAIGAELVCGDVVYSPLPLLKLVVYDSGSQFTIESLTGA